MSTHLSLVGQIRQRGRVLESGARAIHDVLIVTVVACSKAATTVLEGRTAFQLGRLLCLQRVKIGIYAIVD